MTRSKHLRQTSLRAVIFVALALPSRDASAQGCAQCKDNTAAMPASTQAGYRHAILLLAGAGCAIFLAGTSLLRRDR